MDEHKTEIVIYYSACWMLLNIGAAMLNTSHLAMIPELCDSDEARMSLTLIRNTMINLANILAYIAALIVFSYGKLRYDLLLIRCLRWKIHITRYLILLVYLIFMQSWVEDSGGGEEERYRNLMLMCSSVGFISSMVFHVLVKDTRKFDLEVFRIILL